MSTTQTLRFGIGDWSKGTRGILTPSATDKCLIENMRVYSTGLLGPRPLWSAAVATVDSSSGTIYQNDTVIFPAEYSYPEIDTNSFGVWVVLRTGEVRTYLQSNGTLHGTTTHASLVIRDEQLSVTEIRPDLYLVGGFLLDISGPAADGTPNTTLTSVEAAIVTEFGVYGFNCEGSTLHQGRAFYWGEARNATVTLSTNRVYYSDSVITGGDTAYAEFTDEVGAQYFDVDGRVQGCVSVGPNLLIWTESGQWTLMQGSGNPANATFSAIGGGPIPGLGVTPAEIDNTAIFPSSDGMSLVTISAGGQIDDQSLAYLGHLTDARSYGSRPQPTPGTSSLQNSALVASVFGTDFRHKVNGIWTEETNGISAASGYFVTRTHETDHQEHLIFQNNLLIPIEWSTYVREIAADGPSRTAGGAWAEYSETYTDSPGRLVLPRIFAPNKQVRIKRVVIDGYTYESTGTDFPAASLAVKVNDGQGSTNTLALGPTNDVLASVPDAITPIRITATPGPLPYTHFSDVSLETLIGISIEQITVEFEVSEGLIQ